MVQLQRHISNGKLLTNYNNQQVSIIGIVTNVNPNGQGFEMRTVDNLTIPVNLTSPLDDMLEGYIEVHGTSRGTSVTAEEYIQFTPEQTADFDMNGHDQLCNLLSALDNALKWSPH